MHAQERVYTRFFPLLFYFQQQKPHLLSRDAFPSVERNDVDPRSGETADEGALKRAPAKVASVTTIFCPVAL